jgi:hypothetical protein
MAALARATALEVNARKSDVANLCACAGGSAGKLRATLSSLLCRPRCVAHSARMLPCFGLHSYRTFVAFVLKWLHLLLAELCMFRRAQKAEQTATHIDNAYFTTQTA